MLDIFCLSEFAWIVVWLATRSRQKAVLYTAGVFTAGISGKQISGWLALTFSPPASQVFRWFSEQISNRAESVVLSAFIPPTAAGGASESGQWIAYSILKNLFFVAITLSIFLAFVMIGKLIHTLRDEDNLPPKWDGINALFAVASAGYLLMITTIAVGDLAWIKQFSGLVPAINPSLTMHLTASAFDWLNLHHHF